MYTIVIGLAILIAGLLVIMSSWMDEDLGGDMPWMAKAEHGEWNTFSAKVESFDKFKDAGPNGKWSCFRGKMKDITDHEDEQTDEDGEHEVPFWAMKEFQAACKESGKSKGWLELEYKRTQKKDGNSTATFRVAD